MPSAGFEKAILAMKLPQTHALDRSAKGEGKSKELLSDV